MGKQGLDCSPTMNLICAHSIVFDGTLFAWGCFQGNFTDIAGYYMFRHGRYFACQSPSVTQALARAATGMQARDDSREPLTGNGH